MTTENVAASAPVHRVVGQFRELLSRATPGPWEEVWGANRKHVCILEVSGGTPPGGQYSPPSRWKIVGKTLPHAATDQAANAAFIVAAANAMPALLAIAEAAARVAEIDADPNGSVDANGIAIDAMSSALSLLANTRIDGATPHIQGIDGEGGGGKGGK